jgi:muramoyltetrapeptide carboxypeptidase
MKKLQKGDTIGILTPASAFNPNRLTEAISNFEQFGLKVKIASNTLKHNGFLAGTDSERLEDLHTLFADKEVKGIFCVRGGYGAARLLPNIDFKLISENKKIFAGYSDITALLIAFWKKANLKGFHAPMGLANFTDFVIDSYQKTFFKNGHDIIFAEQPQILKSGKATGRLLGGNLAVFVTLLGSEYWVDTRDKILFFEDIDEEPYRIDRFLTQLLIGGHLQQAAGIILGQFTNCETKNESDQSFSVQKVIQERLSNLQIPIIKGFPFGHVDKNMVLPFGAEVEIDSSNASLRFLDSNFQNF